LGICRTIASGWWAASSKRSSSSAGMRQALVPMFRTTSSVLACDMPAKVPFSPSNVMAICAALHTGKALVDDDGSGDEAANAMANAMIKSASSEY